MSVDELSTPLGVDLEPVKQKRNVPWGPVFLGCALVICGALGGFVILTQDPLGGEPVAYAGIERMKNLAATEIAPVAANNASNSTPAGQPASTTNRNATAIEMEQESGVRVVRQNGGSAPAAVMIRVPDPVSPAMRLATSPDKRLVEKNKHGLLPKISSDGLRPFDIYARPVAAAAKTKSARIAIVIGGLGIGQNITADAIQRLPGEVSLAFAPYGSDLERQVQRARDNGHEVLLQAPMEPFDYPDNDPGPQTLLANLSAEQNIDRLQWLMSRFSGYVGVMNFMGGRLTSNGAALAPILKEISSRGLVYLDDGSSAQSLGPTLAAASGLPAARGDIGIDANLRAADIDAALLRLESIAREKGVAIGTGSALPLTIERIARWSRTLESRGIVLVPVSSTISGPKS